MKQERRWTWIWPTPSCGGLCLLLLGIWYAGASQSNGAAYLLFFLVLSVALVSIPHTYFNAKGFEVAALPVRPVFAGDSSTFTFDISKDATRRLKGRLQARLPNRRDRGDSVTVAWLPEERTARVVLKFPAPARGEHMVPDILLETAYPLGFFQASGAHAVKQRYLVYPHPAGRSELPVCAVPVKAHQPEGIKTGGDDFAGLRAYIPGESQRHIDWKAVARGQPLLVKQFAGQRGHEILLDWESLHEMEYESRLSQLALWVQRAEREQHSYALHLPGLRLTHGSGEVHYRECLRALALFPRESPPLP